MAQLKYAQKAKLRPAQSTSAELVDTVEVRVKLDKKLYDSLSWYVNQTAFWVNGKHVEELLSELMTDYSEWCSCGEMSA